MMRPESLMMSYGYKPELSEGSIKCPVFLTSTFVFKTAEEGKAHFEIAYGLRDKLENEELGLIYSRINNPDLEILENRLTLWDKAAECAVFESGMAAISTVMLEFLQPGDMIMSSGPLYGGTDHFIKHFLNKLGIEHLEFDATFTEEQILSLIDQSGKKDKLKLIFLETPANPTNSLIDIEMCSNIAKELSSGDQKIIVAVDNTYMGPLWQHPLDQGADLVLYSATKYIGGHSDVVAGACLGSAELVQRVKTLRTFLGNMASPMSCWLLLRSLETLKVRMDQQAINAEKVAAFLSSHPKVEKIYYLGSLENMPDQKAIYDKQCLSAGAMVSFDIRGGENEAFLFLNNLKLIKLAVSLGGTESLAEHPATMTHAGVDPEYRLKVGITEKLVRLSIGVENYQDLINDIESALNVRIHETADIEN
ncbi:cystathionine gamma-synthase family protein [Daejeonella oryzae]|uniref:cystathionine gamma-synthase family protein n=1 Tax=Daejeonella oryzae TaxID=1122943 RepID=UPI001C655187|nr:cystathionine gamma-synthase family protein [Daejeonella oryzae]